MNINQIIICEGQIDKLSFDEANIPNALSVPDGAPSINTKNYDNKFDFLEPAEKIFQKAKKIILAVDNDEPGKKLEEELARRIGKEKCYRVIWPEGCKDANDVLVKFGSKELRKCIDQAEPYPMEGIFEPITFFDKIDIFQKEGTKPGISPGWDNLAKLYTIKPGELTVVHGLPSAGKSEVLDAIMVNLINKDWKFGVCSPENQPLERHSAKLIEKMIEIKFQDIEKGPLNVGKNLLQKYFTFILPDAPTLNCILSLAKITVFRKGINGLVVDPWNELEQSRPEHMTETEYIGHSLMNMRKFARNCSVAVWIASHPTKLIKERGEYKAPLPYQISSSANWYNKADNIICVHRNYKLPGNVVEIHVQKIRDKYNGEKGMIRLSWNKYNGTYSEYIENKDGGEQ